MTIGLAAGPHDHATLRTEVEVALKDGRVLKKTVEDFKGTPENPLKSRWLGIFNGAGIHGVDPSEYGTIGHAASHGCVRMRIADVEDLYPRVPVGAPIFIA